VTATLRSSRMKTVPTLTPEKTVENSDGKETLYQSSKHDKMCWQQVLINYSTLASTQRQLEHLSNTSLKQCRATESK
jgi:hypothetical protein